MTLQDAIITLKREQFGDSESMELAKQMGAKALERQMPKRVIHAPNHRKHFCSTCHEPIKVGGKYCRNCGQALDWSYNE